MSEDLKTANKFHTKYVSEIEEDKLGDLSPFTKQVRCDVIPPKASLSNNSLSAGVE